MESCHGFKPDVPELSGLPTAGHTDPDVPSDLESLHQQRPLGPPHSIHLARHRPDFG